MSAAERRPESGRGGWAAVDRLLGAAARGLDPQELRVVRLTAAFALALTMWGPLFAGFYALMGAYRLSVFVALAVLIVGTSLFPLRAGKRELAGHQLLVGLLGVLLAIAAYTRGVFSPTLMWLPVLPVIALLLMGMRAALVWGAIPIGAVILCAAAAITGNEGSGIFSGGQLVAYHAVSLLSTVALQASLAVLFESAKVRMGRELAAQRDLATRARDDARRLLDNVGQALFVVDANGTVGPSPSATALEWFGPNDGRAASEWVAGDDLTRANLAGHLRAFKSESFQFERSGRWMALRLVPIRETNSALAICTDITEARRVESAELERRQLSDQLVRAEERSRMLDRVQATDNALREANAKSRAQAQFLASILDNMGEGMVACDPQGNFLLWNPAATRLVGPQANIDSSQWARHYGLFREDGKTLVALEDLPLLRALRGESVSDREILVRTSAAPPDRWIAFSARPLLDDEGKVRLAIAVFRDISERKRAETQLRASEAQLRQAQKMEAIGRLAGGIAHDFNNLLTVIYGNTLFVRDQLAIDHPLRPDVEAVQEAAERAAALTRQLLAFSRKQALETRPLDLNLVVGTLQKMLVRLIGENIDLICTGPSDLGVVRADPAQIEQVIMNLVVNAHDAMPRGGRLIIATSNVDLDEREAQAHAGTRAGSYVLLSVADTGVGMDPETQSHIFEPFFTTKERGKGTGLGLAIVFGITQQSGGHITVHSEPGRGSTFKVYLPRVTDAAEAGGALGLAGPAPRGTETILLAEDEAPVRALVEKRLRELGYQVLVATDGLDALAVQQRHQGSIHLVISDVVMPRMGGPELVRRLLSLVPGLHVIFVSGYAAEALSPHEFAGALPGFLQKPFTPDALARKVREVLGRSRT